MTVVGADAQELMAAAGRLSAAADQLAADSDGLARTLGSVAWLGPVATAFTALFDGGHRQRMAAAAAAIRDAGVRLTAQAEQQVRASEAGGGATGGTGPGGLANGGGSPDAVARADAVNRATFNADLAALTAKEANGTLSDSDRTTLANLRAVEKTIKGIEDATDPLTHEHLHASLLIYDPTAFGGDGRAAVGIGDLDRADNVAFMVPGLGTTLASMSGGRALTVYQESRWASHDGHSVAVVDWVGYDAPNLSLKDPLDVVGVLYRDKATAGAALLAADIMAFRAGRGGNQPHLTVIGNSYGSTTVAISADHDGLKADDVVLTGSPGAGDAKDASNLTTGRDHTWIGSASHDPVSQLGVTGWADPTQVLGAVIGNPGLLGHDPSEDRFHAIRFEAESPQRGTGGVFADHSRYYDPGSESVRNVARVVTGEYGSVVTAQHRYDPWYSGVQDPEGHRTPTPIGGGAEGGW